MRVEMDRQADFLLERLDQNPGSGGFQQARHVLQTQDMCACGFQFLGHTNIILQVILGAGRVEHVAGIADRAFADLVRLDHGIHGDAHVFDPVQ